MPLWLLPSLVWIISWARSIRRASNWSSACYVLHDGFFLGLFFYSEDAELTFSSLERVISQQTELLIIIAARTWDPTCLMSYVFIGVGFPMHRDLIWSVVRPLWIFKQPPCAHTGPARYFHLPENSGTNPSGGDMVNFLDGKVLQIWPSGSLWELWGSLTCSKSTTRVKRLKVPPGGLRSLTFSVFKNSTTSAGFEPASLGSRGGNVTSRLRRPLHSQGTSNFRNKKFFSRPD
jgi:hypothetical protein